MNNLEIMREMINYQSFRGVFLADDMENLRELRKNESMIISQFNHFVAIFKPKGKPYTLFFDSYGLPPTPEIHSFVKGKVLYNRMRMQSAEEDTCGRCCINIIKGLHDFPLIPYGELVSRLYSIQNT
jgi:hypothetical protein